MAWSVLGGVVVYLVAGASGEMDGVTEALLGALEARYTVTAG